MELQIQITLVAVILQPWQTILVLELITKLNDPSKKLKFSLLCCHAAIGKNQSENSFAAQFHHDLAVAHGIKAEVVLQLK